MAFIWKNGAGEVTELVLPDYLVTNYDGFSEAPVRLQTQKSPYQHGTTLIDTMLEPRHCWIELVIAKDVFKKRKELIRAFSPRLGQGTLTWEQDEDKYNLRAIPEEAPVMPAGSQGVSYQIVLINLMAPDPTFYADEKIVFELDSSATARINVYNEGAIDTPVIIEIPGECENPKLTNLSTGEEIIFDDLNIGSDEKLRINTKFGQKRIEIIDEHGQRTSAFGELEMGSVLFYLQPGNNQVDFRADTGEPVVKFEFYERYGGV